MIVVRSRVAVILPEIPQGRRTSPWRRWRHEDEPSVDERVLTIATKRELSREAHNIVNTPHMNKAWCTTSMMHGKATWSYSWQEMMQTRTTHQGKFKWGREQHITIPVSPHMHISKLVQIWINLMFKLLTSKLRCTKMIYTKFYKGTYKVHLVRSYGLEDMSKTS